MRSKPPGNERRAYEERLKVWEEEIARAKRRGKKPGEMQMIASEQVDWWTGGGFPLGG